MIGNILSGWNTSSSAASAIIIVANDRKTQQQKATATLCLSTLQTRNAILGSTMRPVKTGAMCGCASGDAGSSVRHVASEHEAPSSSIFNISGRGNRTAHKHAQTNKHGAHARVREDPACLDPDTSRRPTHLSSSPTPRPLAGAAQPQPSARPQTSGEIKKGNRDKTNPWSAGCSRASDVSGTLIFFFNLI